VDLTTAIAVESTMLPCVFNRDPADQIIVATARLLDCPIITSDQKMLAYPHVKHILQTAAKVAVADATVRGIYSRYTLPSSFQKVRHALY
jgi:predicted nuclease of predicted toxin-antitoxin system